MRLMIMAAGAAALALAACGQDTETAPVEETVAAEDAAMDAAATTPSAAAPMSGAPAADAPASSDMAAPGPGPVTDETRDAAQAEAEATNLHPRTE